MPELRQALKQLRGISPQYNQINLQPVGALSEAFNVRLRREGVLTPRPGFALDDQGSVLVADMVKGFPAFSTLYFHDGTNMYRRDADNGNLTLIEAITPPSGVKVAGVEVSEGLFVTTSTGIKRLDTEAGTFSAAGMPRGLNENVTSVSTTPALAAQAPDNRVNIVHQWKRTLSSGRVLRGAPSFPQDVPTNPKVTITSIVRATNVVTVDTETAHNVQIGDTVTIEDVTTTSFNGSFTVVSTPTSTQFTYAQIDSDESDSDGTAGLYIQIQRVIVVPDDIVAGDILEVFRTEQSGGASVPAGEDFFLIGEVVYTSGSTVTFTETSSSILRTSTPLQTNDEGGEGGSQLNFRPPLATDINVYKNFTAYANVKREQRLFLTLSSTDDFTHGVSTITITDGTTTLVYTAEAAEDTSNDEFLADQASTALSTKIENTCRSFVNVVNQDSSNTLVYAHYISGEADDPGQMLLEARTLGQVAFSVTADSTATGNQFSPNLPTSGTTVSSDDDEAPHRIYFSRIDEPDHVPEIHSVEMPSKEHAILRITPLRESLIIHTTKGVYSVTGRTIASFTVTEEDPTVIAIARETITELNNEVWAATNQGIIATSESGSALISRRIESEFEPIQRGAAFPSTAFAIAREDTYEYMVWIPITEHSADPIQAYVYHYISKEWCVWAVPATGGLLNPADGKLYLGGVDDTTKRILQERREPEFINSDSRDEDVAITVDAVSTTTATDPFGNSITVSSLTVTYNYAKDFTDGFLFVQNDEDALIDSVTLISGNQYTIVLDRELGLVETGAATVSVPIDVRFRLASITGGDVGLQKKFQEFQMYEEIPNTTQFTFAFSTDISRTEETKILRKQPNIGLGEIPFNEQGFGELTPAAGSDPYKMWPPLNKRRGSVLNVAVQHRRANENFRIVNFTIHFKAGSHRPRRRFP